MSEPTIRFGEFVDDAAAASAAVDWQARAAAFPSGVYHAPDIFWGINPDGSRILKVRPGPAPRRRPRSRIGRALRGLARSMRWFFSMPSLCLMGVGALLGVALVLLSTPNARADDNTDDAFLSVLAAEGFSYDHANTDKVINNGRQVCELLADGAAPFDIVTSLAQTEPDIDRPGASLFAALANAVYCPQFGTEVSRA